MKRYYIISIVISAVLSVLFLGMGLNCFPTTGMIEENIEALTDGELLEEMKAQSIWYIGPIVYSDGTSGVFCETGGIEVCLD